MFHKRSLKRSINTSDTTSDDHATSWKSLQPKRLKTEDYSEQTKAQDDAAVRRSSRAPKPKVFDDDYTDIGVRSPGSEHETLKNKEPRPLSRNQGERSSVDDEEFAKRRSSRVPKPKLFDKEYLETAKSRGTEDKEEEKMAFATAVRVSQDWQKESSFQKGPTKCKKTTMSVSKQGKTDVSASAAGGRQPRPAMKGNEGPGASETPKVRTSLRTPMPKKIFALIDDSPVSRTGEGGEGLFEGDLYVDIVTQESHATKHSKKVIISQSDLDIIGTSPISSKKNWTSTDAGSHGGKHKKSKKLNTAMVDSSTFLYSEAEAPKKCDTIKKQSVAKEKFKNISSKATNKTSGKVFKKHTTKNKPSDVSEDVVDVVVGIQQMEGNKKSKKKTAEVEQSELPSVSPDMLKTMSTGIEHGKNGSKHSKLKHKDEPHSEVKDKGHHIILKVHLPHGEPYHHPHHSHSHKKHKHKHSSETKTESGSSENKPKKAKSSHESDASTSPDKQRKKLSIKFKGLSSSTPGVEFQGTENIAETEKKNKELERVPKKKKPAKSSLDKLGSGSDDKEHVKVVIKKHKKDLEVITNEGQKLSKKLSKSTVKDVTEKKKEGHGKAETPIKTTSPKKKMKTSESPKSTEKEKRKIVTGYLLFCKKERSRIHEAHPGLEFAQISQKVGEAWKSLPESIKQEWKAKADYVKKNLTPTKEDKKTEATKPGPDAIDMAAHLKLLGESLSVIGGSLMAQKETEVHGSLSVLLDSILCAICPLTFLTSHIPGIPGISKETQMQILDDLAYTMPGLG